MTGIAPMHEEIARRLEPKAGSAAGATAVYRFGSGARGEARDGSVPSAFWAVLAVLIVFQTIVVLRA